LARLWIDDTARAEMAPLLEGARWMVMPLRECAAAPAQGALAIECRADDPDTAAKLQRIHDPRTQTAIERERAWLARWGGGCHQRFGATFVAHPAFLDGLLFMAGRNPAGESCDELHWSAPPRPTGTVREWSGGNWRKRAAHDLDGPVAAVKGALFLAHARALPKGAEPQVASARVWTSGTPSWFELARRGVWVEGCGEGLSYAWIRPLLAEPVLGLPAEAEWTVLTHTEALGDWSALQATATYSVSDLEYPAEAIAALREATHVYWSSGSQWKALGSQAPATAHFACGPGKTAETLRAGGVRATVFPALEDWQKWLGNSR
jgi:hydroxymethylbilane synthase